MIVQFTQNAIVSNFVKATLYATARLVNINVIQKFFILMYLNYCTFA